MARRYDSKTTIFSPEGRLYQVEYAMEAIGHAGTCLGILAKDGILLAAERRNTNKLLGECYLSEFLIYFFQNYMENQGSSSSYLTYFSISLFVKIEF